MIIKQEIDEFELPDRLWSGGLANYRTIEAQCKEHEFIELIEEIYPDGVELTTLNDILWFDFEWLCEELGIKDYEEGNTEELEDYEIEEDR